MFFVIFDPKFLIWNQNFSDKYLRSRLVDELFHKVQIHDPVLRILATKLAQKHLLYLLSFIIIFYCLFESVLEALCWTLRGQFGLASQVLSLIQQIVDSSKAQLLDLLRLFLLI